MPVGVLTNVCAVFIGTFIGGLIKKVLPKHLMEELPKVFGICSLFISCFDVFNVWNGIIWSPYRRNVRRCFCFNF